MSSMAETRPFVILLVEDNPGDVRLAREALKEGKVSKHIHVAEDGVEALTFLRNSLKNGGEQGPDLVLLDLNLPGKNGHEVLAAIRADEQLRQTPVIVFTSSAAEPDIHRAYELHANCYVTKPTGFAELIDTIKRIESFWLTTATLPTRHGVHT